MASNFSTILNNISSTLIISGNGSSCFDQLVVHSSFLDKSSLGIATDYCWDLFYVPATELSESFD